MAANCEDNLDADVASYIPSFEKLSFRSLPFVHHFDDSSDQTWLPQLKAFQLTESRDSCRCLMEFMTRSSKVGQQNRHQG